ncbi:MAG: hypothetical protein IIB56_11690 [Planctomycetes bacterium]|nr:hypothetical protein [Planctomycetota bacterium]
MPVLCRHGKGRCAKIATPKAANVSARRRGCANNPVEPAAIQAAARPAITAIRPKAWIGSNPPTAAAAPALLMRPLDSPRPTLSFSFFAVYFESLSGLYLIPYPMQ